PYADVLLPEAIQDTRAMGPAGQLWSTVPDLARWAAFIGGDTGDVLDGDTLAAMCEPAALMDDPGCTRARGLGLEVARRAGRLLVGNVGSMPGFQARVHVDRVPAPGVVSLHNVTTAGDAPSTEGTFDVLDACEPRLPPTWVPQSAVPAGRFALTGSW